jgi:L-2-amino-thiazoline-4-carboxylic acid hydrolase
MDSDLTGILGKRRAQAEVIKPIYEVLLERLGKPEAMKVIEEAIRRAAVEEGRAFAAKESEGTDLASFAGLQPQWIKSGALELTPLRQTSTEFAYNVTRCKYAVMYIEMGLGEIGHLLSCNRDATFIEGYNPNIKLTRTQTIMQGAEFSDFRYQLDTPKAEEGP